METLADGKPIVGLPGAICEPNSSRPKDLRAYLNNLKD
jgi:hypothetical protein